MEGIIIIIIIIIIIKIIERWTEKEHLKRLSILLY